MDKEEQKAIRGTIFLVSLFAFLIAWGIVSESDYQEELDQQDHYIEMVCAGHWPDYDDRNPDCG